MSVLVLSGKQRFFRRSLEKWNVGEETQIILHSELRLAWLFASLTDKETPQEQKAELRREIRELLRAMKKRNHLHSVEPIETNMKLILDAIGEQLAPDPEVLQKEALALREDAEKEETAES